MSHNYRIEQTEEGYRVHFCEDTNFPFSILDEKEESAISRANMIACGLARQEMEFLKSVRYSKTYVAMTATDD